MFENNRASTKVKEFQLPAILPVEILTHSAIIYQICISLQQNTCK